MSCETISNMPRTKRSSLVGYARVTSIPRHTRLQRDALAEADCVRVFEDKISSRTTDRPGLIAALDYPRPHRTIGRRRASRLIS